MRRLFRNLFPLTKSFGSRGVSAGRRAAVPGRGRRPEVELLEGRQLLSTVTPISTTISAEAWQTPGLSHQALFVIGSDDAVHVSLNGGAYKNLGGYAKQISASLDPNGNAEVFAIGLDDAVYVYDLGNGNGWVDLGGYAKQISANANDTVYAIGMGNGVYLNNLSDGDHGSGWVDLGGDALQISTYENSGVYAIGADHAVYVWSEGWVDLGGYAKQISAGLDPNGNSEVYAIGMDDAVYVNEAVVNEGHVTGGSGWVDLGGYAKQISASLDPEGIAAVYAIGLNNAVYVNTQTEFFGWSGWGDLGGYAREVAAQDSGFGAYVVGSDHQAYYNPNNGSGFVGLGGYIPFTTTTDQSGTISATSWVDASGTTHNALYAIGKDDAVLVSTGTVQGLAAQIDPAAPSSAGDGTFTDLRGYAKQISAGLDANGQPEVYAIGIDDAVYVNDGNGWADLGGYAKQISATLDGTVYAIGKDNSVSVHNGSGKWVDLGGYALQISASLDGANNPEVYAIGVDSAVYVNDGNGWVDLGGYAKQISAGPGAFDQAVLFTAGKQAVVGNYNTVFAIGIDDAVYVNDENGWVDLGGYAKQISAGLDPDGQAEVYAIGSDNALYVNDNTGWNDLGGYVRQIAAPPNLVTPINSDAVFAIGLDQASYFNNGDGYTDLGGYFQG
jgi:hypothetical protein